MTTPQAALLEALKETLRAHELGVFMSGRGLDKARAALAQAEAAQPVARVAKFVGATRIEAECLPHNGALMKIGDALYAAPQPAEAAPKQEAEDRLWWLWTHCRALGMVKKSLSGLLEHDIALFTADLHAHSAPKQEAVAAAKRALHWVRDGDKDCGYNNWVAETPLGRILITWKGWKEDHYATVDEFPGAALGVVGDPDELRDLAESEFWRRVDALAAQPQQPAPEPVARVPLTKELIAAAWRAWPRTSITSAARAIEFVRAVERFDGIAAPQPPAPGDTEGRA